MGFFTTRFVEARNPEKAGIPALDLLRGEGELNPLNDHCDPPRIFIDAIEKVDPADVSPLVHGFTFFLDERDADD
jgi:hypothetical protein